MSKDIIKIDIVGTEIEENTNEMLELIDEITEREELKINTIRKLIENADKIMIALEKLGEIETIRNYLDATKNEKNEIKN